MQDSPNLNEMSKLYFTSYKRRMMITMMIPRTTRKMMKVKMTVIMMMIVIMETIPCRWAQSRDHNPNLPQALQERNPLAESIRAKWLRLKKHLKPKVLMNLKPKLIQHPYKSLKLKHQWLSCPLLKILRQLNLKLKPKLKHKQQLSTLLVPAQMKMQILPPSPKYCQNTKMVTMILLKNYFLKRTLKLKLTQMLSRVNIPL